MRTHTTALNNYLNDGNGRKISVKLVCGTDKIESVQSLSLETEFGDTIAIGNTVSSYIRVTCQTPSFSISGKEFTLFFGAKLSENADVTWTKIGLFTVAPEELENRMGFSTFTAYDRMAVQTKAVYNSTLKYPKKMHEVLNDILAGTSFAAPALTADPNVDQDYFSEYTVRDAIGFIASYQGKNAYVDCDGKLIFKWFASCNYTADGTKANIPYADERNIAISRAICSTGEDTLASGTGSDAIMFNNPFMDQTRLDQIKTATSITYRRLDADIPVGNYLIEPGDIIKVTSSGETLSVPAMSVSFSYDGGLSCKVSSYGVADSISKSISAKKFTDHTKIKGLHKEIEDATATITGASGGYVRINFGDDGKTAEILVMDTQYTTGENAAKNVWRWNQNGFGHSSNGYLGPYDTAITKEGKIIADFIGGNTLAGVVIKTVSNDDEDKSYGQLEEGGLVFYTRTNQRVGMFIELYEDVDIGESTAGTALLTEPERWIGIGKDYNGTGWEAEFIYRPSDFIKFKFKGAVGLYDDVYVRGEDGEQFNLVDRLITIESALGNMFEVIDD